MSYGVAEDERKGQTAVKEVRPVRTRSLRTPTVRRKDLFEDSLLETSRGRGGGRAWTTLFSLTVQCLLVGILILVPLLYTQVLPKEQVVTMLVAPPPPPPPPPAAPPTPVKEARVVSDIVNGQLRTPSRIPDKVLMIKEPAIPPPASAGGVVGGVPGGVPGGQLGGMIGGIIGSISHPVAIPKLYKSIARVRISQGVVRGLLVRQVQPTYPALAKEARIQGRVVLTAIIGKGGTIQKLQVVSGHPMLVPAAINAVKQWRYKPYLLNGQPVEVVTTITVNFNLGG
ncbi:MAG TPA: energy transducer TonB [Candidatus Sulfotelmatobacter sp.]|nr:energy transducer TonB [Candidatus Sulfotelmatobacter sp.]